MTRTDDTNASTGHAYRQEIELERAGWTELLRLCRELRPAERLEPGYYVDPDWSVRDVVGHVGAWLAEGKAQLERIASGTYDRQEVDIDALNAQFLAAMRDQPWDLVRLQATAARHAMLAAWAGLDARSAEADWWVRKCGADHYGEHLPRLREWVAELRGRAPASTGR
jgi:mycothiol maleylpyruvate isomerase-like protein